MMANMSDILLSKLESISWLYSIECQIHGRNSTLLLKYIIEEDLYAVMVTDLTMTFFECLEGKDIDEHYRRFNKGEIKRARLLSYLKSMLDDVKNANPCLETLQVDCHTSRLTLKLKKQLNPLKIEWSFYMISTNPETLSRHVTIPFLRLVSSLRSGIDLLHKEINNKNKQLEQLDDSNADSLSDTFGFEKSLVRKITSTKNNSNDANDDNSWLINHLLNDQIINPLLRHLQNADDSQVNDSSNNDNRVIANLKREPNSEEKEMDKRRELDSQLNTDSKRLQSTTRTNKKLKL